MLPFLTTLLLLLTAADHWTTYRCLVGSAPGWNIYEGNPLAEWLFATAGLGPGLWLDSVLTVCTVALLLRTPLLPARLKRVALAAVAGATAAAVLNNLGVLAAARIPLLAAG